MSEEERSAAWKAMQAHQRRIAAKSEKPFATHKLELDAYVDSNGNVLVTGVSIVAKRPGEGRGPTDIYGLREAVESHVPLFTSPELLKCARAACSNTGPEWFNKSTRALYCESCAQRINKENEKDALRLYGGPLCEKASVRP